MGFIFQVGDPGCLRSDVRTEPGLGHLLGFSRGAGWRAVGHWTELGWVEECDTSKVMRDVSTLILSRAQHGDTWECKRLSNPIPSRKVSQGSQLPVPYQSSLQPPGPARLSLESLVCVRDVLHVTDLLCCSQLTHFIVQQQASWSVLLTGALGWVVSCKCTG